MSVPFGVNDKAKIISQSTRQYLKIGSTGTVLVVGNGFNAQPYMRLVYGINEDGVKLEQWVHCDDMEIVTA